MYCNVHVLGEQSNRCEALSSYIVIVLLFPSYLQTQMFAPRNSSPRCTLQLVISHEALISTRRRKVRPKQSQPAVRWWSYCCRQTGRGWAASPLTLEPKTAKEWPRCTWHVQEAMYLQCRSWWLTFKVCKFHIKSVCTRSTWRTLLTLQPVSKVLIFILIQYPSCTFCLCQYNVTWCSLHNFGLKKVQWMRLASVLQFSWPHGLHIQIFMVTHISFYDHCVCDYMDFN